MPFFFFNDPATTEIYTLSLHDALPICRGHEVRRHFKPAGDVRPGLDLFDQRAHRQVTLQIGLLPGGDADVARRDRDRKSTRLNSSHANISYAVFCLKKKKNIKCK